MTTNEDVQVRMSEQNMYQQKRKCNTVKKLVNSKTEDNITLKDSITKCNKWQRTKTLRV